MSLTGYEQAKLELAQTLRSMDAVVSKADEQVRDQIKAAQTRLAEDRFNVSVVGRFSRGKSSLMNAMLRTDRLPTGVEPLTSVITSVSYGSRERVYIHRETGLFPLEITIEELPNYVSEHGNPGNEKGVKIAEIQLPAELLRAGFYFVDTPGLGSSITENTETTQRFLPEIDALVLVTTFEEPLDASEIEVVNAAVSSGRKTFVILNKADLFTKLERDGVRAEISSRMQERFQDASPPVFPLSALEAIRANGRADSGALLASGVPAFQGALVEFLAEHKAQLIIEQMLRSTRSLRDGSPELSGSQEVALGLERSGTAIEAFAKSHEELASNIWTANHPEKSGNRQVCAVCGVMDRELRDFLSHYQYELLVKGSAQQDLAKRHGFCPLHTWQYEAIASPQGVSASQPPLLLRIDEELGSLAEEDDPKAAAAKIHSLLPNRQTCPMCCAGFQAETTKLEELAQELRNNDEAEGLSLCLRHTGEIAARLESRRTVQVLVNRLRTNLQRDAQDMGHHAIKHEGTRRYLMTEEEKVAYLRGLLSLAGPRTLAMPVQVKEIA